jgi:hypothetical protein
MRLAPPDQQIDPGAAVVGAQADVVGRALVGELGVGGQGVVDGEPGRVGEEGVQRPLRLPVLQRAVQIGVQVGRGEVDTAVGAVRARRHRRGVGGPHGRGRGRRRRQGRRVLPRPLQHLGVRAAEAEASQEADIGPLVRRQDELRQAEVRQPLHLVEPLQHRRARVGRLALEAGREIAGGQARIGMRRPDQPVIGRSGALASTMPRRSRPQALDLAFDVLDRTAGLETGRPE